jgi:uncharacterized protein YcbX
MDAYLLIAPVLAAVIFACLLVQSRSRSTINGHRHVILNGPSNMKDETDKKYTRPPGRQPAQSPWTVKSLYFHPIKSCAAVEVTVADVDLAGFTWDRKFAFAELLQPRGGHEAKESSWTFRTLRTPGWERLALVKPEIWVADGTENKGWLVIKYPNIPAGSLALLAGRLGLIAKERSFRVPLVPPPDHKYPSETVQIWKDFPSWLNYGVHVPKSFASFIGTSNPVTLFRVDPNSYREVFRCAPRKEQLGHQPVIGFADAYPGHLLNISSVRDIAGRVEKSIPHFSARRFRSNILVDGPSAYDEDDWKKIRIGSHAFYCACRTVRCRLPNVDPDTAERHPIEPDKTLKSFRCIDEGDPLNACLGLQLVPAEMGPFQIRVGDQVEVLERGHHKYIKQ